MKTRMLGQARLDGWDLVQSRSCPMPNECSASLERTRQSAPVITGTPDVVVVGAASQSAPRSSHPHRKWERGAVALVVAAPPVGLSRAHGQKRLFPGQRLNLRFLIYAKYQSVGRIHVAARKVAHFLNEQRTLGKLESLTPM